MIRKKTLIVSSEFPPEPGGIGNHAYNLAKYLSRNNYEVTVISDQRLKDFSIEEKFDKSVSFMVQRTQLKNNRVFMYFNRISQVFNEIKKNDIIIASGKFSLLVVAFASFFSRKRFVAVIHGTEVNFKKKILKKSIDFSLKRFHKIIAVSNYTKSLVTNLSLKNIEVICNGFEINSSFNKEYKEKLKGFPSIITVGSVSQRKGQHNILNALPEIIKVYPKVHYHIVGKPIEKKKLLNIAKKLGLLNYISFYGIVTEKQKNNLLLGSDIFMMLSENTSEGDVEGFGIALLEANFFGIPTIGSKKCGIEDAILNYKSGILVDNKNSKVIINSIKEIIENYPNYQTEAKKWATGFTWDVIIKKYIKAINF